MNIDNRLTETHCFHCSDESSKNPSIIVGNSWFQIIVVAIAINADSYRGQSCPGPGRTVHIARDGTERCCIELTCAKGTLTLLVCLLVNVEWVPQITSFPVLH